MKKIQIYGTRSCSDCIRTKHWLREHNVAYEELLLEESEQHVDDVLRITKGETKTPVVIFLDGTFLIEPTNEELARKIIL